MDKDRDELIERVAAELRHPVKLSAELDDRIMSIVRERPRTSGFAAWTEWLLRPRAIRLTPAGALAGAAVLVLALFATWEFARRDLRTAPSHQVTGLGETPDGVQVVQFVFVAPRASSVALVGDFNGWDTEATPMLRGAGSGVWTVSIPLAVGRHQYAFLVDRRRWEADPAAPPAISEDFGTPSSVITVAGSGA